ncbi:MAG: hypothetical protein AAF911_15675 [Planctomycetota bacterium]
MLIADIRRDELKVAVQNLYRVFGRYRFTDTIGDAAFPGFCDPGPMLAVSLDQVPADALDRFHSKALTTWGNADDFRHFLPRMLELSIENGFTLDREFLWAKLDYGNWHEWPRKEIEAIEDFSLALWKCALAEGESVEYVAAKSLAVDELLVAYARASRGLQIYLDQWEQDLASPDTEVSSAINLSHCLDSLALTTKHRPNWQGENDQECNQLMDWLIGINPPQTIETIFFRHAESIHAERLSKANEYASWFWTTQGLGEPND